MATVIEHGDRKSVDCGECGCKFVVADSEVKSKLVNWTETEWHENPYYDLVPRHIAHSYTKHFVPCPECNESVIIHTDKHY